MRADSLAAALSGHKIGPGKIACDQEQDDAEAPLTVCAGLVLHPRWTKGGYRYDVAYDGEVVVRNSRDPEHDAARALRRIGITGLAETVDAGTGQVHLRFDIERFAATCTVERAAGGLSIEAWRPMPLEIPAVRSQSGASVVEGKKARQQERASATDRRRTT